MKLKDVIKQTYKENKVISIILFFIIVILLSHIFISKVLINRNRQYKIETEITEIQQDIDDIDKRLCIIEESINME